VKRPKEIVLRGINRHGKPIRLHLEGDPARIALHEIDHLDGILFIDRAIRETLRWEHPNREDEEESV
jgi:peptide deformylase